MAALYLTSATVSSTDKVGYARGYELRRTRGIISQRTLVCVGGRFFETGLPPVGRVELEEKYAHLLFEVADAADRIAVEDRRWAQR